jgi:predicted ribosomally synthesized peptide with nif11-like leader
MSLQKAQAFIDKMKSDNMFSEAILGAQGIEERLALASEEGVPCSIEDIEALEAFGIESQSQNSNLPLSYQCKGPCHTKCAAVVA